MMPAPFYTLLSICQSKEYMKKKANINTLKDSVAKFLQYESDKSLEVKDIAALLTGWELVLEDKCNKNELQAIKTIN